MTYDKHIHRVANRDFVREVTRWPGHTKVVNIPVEYNQLMKIIFRFFSGTFACAAAYAIYKSKNVEAVYLMLMAIYNQLEYMLCCKEK